MALRDRIEVGEEGERLALRLDLADPPRERRTVLYLHGFGTDQRAEKAAFFRSAALGSGYSFASFDFRGHGDSDGLPRRLSVTRNLEDAKAVAEWLGARGHTSLVLLGSSMGGGCALWLSALNPGLAEVTATIAPALDLPSGFLALAGREGIERWRSRGVLTFDDGERSIELDWTVVEDGRRYRPDDLPERLTTPTLLLQGRLDDRVDWRGATRLTERCQAVELHLFGDGDHRLADRKDRLWELIRGFIASHAAER